MTWQMLITLQIVFASLNVLSFRALARIPKAHNASFAMNGAMFLILYASALPVALIAGGLNPDALGRYWLWFAGGGLGFTLANVCTYKLFSHLDSAVGSVLSTIGALFTIILAALVLHEDLTVRQAAGAGFLLLSVVYAVLLTRHRSFKTRSQLSWLIGLGYAILAGLFTAAALVNEKYLLGHMNVPTYVVFGWGGQAAVSVITALLLQRNKFRLLKDMHILRLSFANGFTRAAAGACFVLSQVRSGNVALVTVVSYFRLILIVVLGAWLLKERQKLLQKLIASAVAIIGLSFLF